MPVGAGSNAGSASDAVTRGQDAPTTIPPLTRGAACTKLQRCTGDLRCAPLDGGYCTSSCGSRCDGSCVDTPRFGELCMAKCASDAECRTGEGYVCDPVWRACLVPNLTAIQPRQCPGTLDRDPAFGATTRLSTAALEGGYQNDPSSVLLNDGGVVTMFSSRTTAGPDVLGVASVDLQGSATIMPVRTNKPRHTSPRLARDRRDAIYAVWHGAEPSGQGAEIGFSISKDRGQTWSSPIAVNEAGDCAPERADCLDKPMLVVGPDPQRRTEDIVYAMYGAEGLRVRASRDRGATWSPAVTALEGHYGNATVGVDGRLHVVTLNGSPLGGFGAADHAIEYTVSADGGATFDKPRRVSILDEMLPYYFANPSIAVDSARGWLYVVYARGGRDAKWDLVIAASKDRGATWKRTRIGDDCAIHMVPNVALDPTTGALHLAWYDSRGAIGRFAHASCKPGALVCKQHGRLDDTPFAALSTVRLASRWIGDSQALLVDSKRRLLHAVWSQPIAEQGAIVTRIVHARGKLPRQ